MEEILKLIEHFGWLAVIIVYFIIKVTPTLGRWISKIGDTYVERTVNDVSRLQIEKHDILSHRFFCYMDRCIIYYIDYISIENEYKERVTKDFLKIKYKVFVEGMHNFFNDESIYKLSYSDFEKSVENKVIELISSYNKKALEEGIPQLFIDKFDQWHKKNVELVMTMIQDICKSKWIIGNERTAMSILNILVAAFEMTMIDAEKTLKYLNGDFVGQSYKGIICLPERHEG